MADQPTNNAGYYRQAAKDFLENLSGTDAEKSNELSLQSSAVALWSIAAELAEMNSRDRAAEIRANTAEAFVAGIQEELRKQGIIMAGGMPNVKMPRGR